MSDYFEIPVGEPQNTIFVCGCGKEGEWCSDNNASGHAEWYCGSCDDRRAEKYGCARIIKEGCGCFPGPEDCACGCVGTRRR